MRRGLTLIKIPNDWHTILKAMAAINEFRPAGGGESIGEHIIAPALCQYPPIIQFIKEHNLTMPKCEEQ